MDNTSSRSEFIRMLSSSQGALTGFILSLHPDRTAAFDILQETNVVLWEKIDQFRPDASFKAWAFKIAYLQTLAHLKRRKRDYKVCFASSLVETLAIEAEPLLGNFEERQQALNRCVSELVPHDLAILQAHYVERKPLAEISLEVHRSVGALKQVLFRLRKSLRICIERRINGDLANG